VCVCVRARARARIHTHEFSRFISDKKETNAKSIETHS